MAPDPKRTPGSFPRPKIHFTANSWINDPCAPGYDPSTGTYHLFYQCNPKGCEWGNMSWGHIVSTDMLSWTQANPAQALLPDEPYDCDGVFTGCWIPAAAEGFDKTVLTVAYSSVRKLPFHWSMPSYPRDAAGLSIAVSRDGGRVWTKSTRNPVLSGEPVVLDVTGWRDPYVTELPALDAVRGTGEADVLYGLVSGGIRGVGPTTFLYEIRRQNLEDWRYICPLVDLPQRFQPSEKWSGNYGINWECTNIVTLQAGAESRHFLIIGAEGDVEKEQVRSYGRPEGAPSRTVRAQLWMSGRLVRNANGDNKFQYERGGYLDHGPYYAANSFLDPICGRRIVYGWIPEEDLGLEAAVRKGWNGSLALPREVFLLRIPRVCGTSKSSLQDIYPFELKSEADGSTTVLTLGVTPLSELVQLRKTCRQVTEHRIGVPLPAADGTEHWRVAQTQHTAWELEATIAVRPGCEEVGFHLRHSKDLSTRTTVVFSLATETITVDRHASNRDPTINKCPDSGPFTLLKMCGDGGDSEPVLEELHLRIFADGDVLEVFANDRFALATMVYSDDCGPDAGGITAFALGNVNGAVFESVTVWDGLDTASRSQGVGLEPNGMGA